MRVQGDAKSIAFYNEELARPRSFVCAGFAAVLSGAMLCKESLTGVVRQRSLPLQIWVGESARECREYCLLQWRGQRGQGAVSTSVRRRRELWTAACDVQKPLLLHILLQVCITILKVLIRLLRLPIESPAHALQSKLQGSVASHPQGLQGVCDDEHTCHSTCCDASWLTWGGSAPTHAIATLVPKQRQYLQLHLKACTFQPCLVYEQSVVTIHLKSLFLCRFLIQVLPAAVVAPLYFRGEIEFGVINQSSSAFNHILSDVSLVVYQVKRHSQSRRNSQFNPLM